jgi:hypothetical protein
MVERVARALAVDLNAATNFDDAVSRDLWFAAARAAIAAMREPDQQMLNAVGAVATPFWIKTWAKMIDAALAEESPPAADSLPTT